MRKTLDKRLGKINGKEIVEVLFYNQLQSDMIMTGCIQCYHEHHHMVNLAELYILDKEKCLHIERYKLEKTADLLWKILKMERTDEFPNIYSLFHKKEMCYISIRNQCCFEDAPDLLYKAVKKKRVHLKISKRNRNKFITICKEHYAKRQMQRGISFALLRLSANDPVRKAAEEIDKLVSTDTKLYDFLGL